MKKQASHIFLRGSIYYYRRRIPPHLNTRKSHSVVFSLNTQNYNEALHLAGWYDIHLDDKVFKSKIHGVKMAKNHPIDMVIAGPNGEPLLDISPEEIKLLGDGIHQVIANAQALQANAYNSKSARQVTTEMPSQEPLKDKQSEYPKLSVAIEEFYEQKKLLRKTFSPSPKQKTAFRRLIEMLGDVTINKINAHEATFVLKTIQSLPAQSEKFRGQAVADILAQGPFEKVFAVKNVNDYLDEYKSFFKVMHRLYAVPNVFEGLVVKDTGQRKDVPSYDRNDLKVLFAQPIFQLLEYKKEYEFWTPLIALLSGARRGEIAQLRTYDIQQQDGIWYFDFNETLVKGDTGKKRLKNTQSSRQTPIHPFLIELGLIEYKDSLKVYRLFADSGTWNEKEGYGRYVGEKFNAVSKQAGISPEKTFKSFRATAISELERMGVSDRDRFLLTGRVVEYQTVEQKHYLDRRDLSYLAQQIGKLDFADCLQGIQSKWKK